MKPFIKAENRPATRGLRFLFGNKGILFRTAALAWGVVILTLGLFLAMTISYQRRTLVNGMESLAEVIATSVEQVTVSSIVVEDYSSVIEHCLKVVGERRSVVYLVITRKDGFSLVSQAGGWAQKPMSGLWKPDLGEGPRKAFIQNPLEGSSGKEVYHYTYPLRYSGIDWGWIHVGLSTRQFVADERSLYIRTILSACVCILAGSALSLLFARRLSSPLVHLNEVTRRVTEGDLDAKARISTGDEVESLASSFNRMTEALLKARSELEMRVEERTRELKVANEHLRDEIAERARAEEARAEAERELERQRALSLRADHLRSLGEMAAGMAHELNQPLVGVRGLAEHILIGMERGWDLPQEKLKDRLSRILEQSDRMVHIIEHVRRFAREAGKLDLSDVQVNEVISSGVDLVGAQFRSHGVELTCQLAEGLPVVRANPFSLEEVLLNLLKNALDAVEESKLTNGPRVSPRITIRSREEREGLSPLVKMEVEDTGVGISPEALEKVFDPFFTTKDPDRGTGLGLSISRSIVLDFGGDIQIRSTPGEGTTVTVLLPAWDAAWGVS